VNWPIAVDPLRSWLTGWPDPPWLMTGQTITVWFEPPPELSQRLLGTDFASTGGPPRRARLRFYYVSFTGSSADSWQRDGSTGHFREAVFALPAELKGIEGEVSTHMWTDDDTYLQWGREVFGWPLQRGEITLTGSLWSDGGNQGAAAVRTLAGTASIEVSGLDAGPNTDQATSSGPWLTPRRVLPTGSVGRGTVEVTAVEPVVVTPGTRELVHATAEVSFTDGHPLHGLPIAPLRAEVHRGFELLVGSAVSVVTSWVT
jgi:hypothetical protein